MTTLSYAWHADDAEHTLRLVHVPDTKRKPFPFGREGNHRHVEIAEFYLATTPVTQALWLHVMGGNPSLNPNPLCPLMGNRTKEPAASVASVEGVITTGICTARSAGVTGSRRMLTIGVSASALRSPEDNPGCSRRDPALRWTFSV